MDKTRFLAITRHEAELLMDSFRVGNPLTHDLALKAASLVLEFAAQDTDSISVQCGTMPCPSGGDGEYYLNV
jgi:hypothetical protein